MGLDMYLTAEKYLWSGSDDGLAEQIAALVDTRHKVKAVRARAGYWRKANAIHGWFVDNVQDGDDNCREYYVDFDDIKTLLELCEQVRADKSKAAELLPPRNGFFFGSDQINDDYWQDIDDTIKQLTEAMADFGESWQFYYQASW